jgi:hypothetical protein
MDDESTFYHRFQKGKALIYFEPILKTAVLVDIVVQINLVSSLLSLFLRD